MAARVYDDNPAFVAPAFTRTADGTIVFGALVEVGASAGEVKETAGETSVAIGVAWTDEAIYDKTGDSQYTDGDAVIVKALLPGKIYYLKASEAISEGDNVHPAADGEIAKHTNGTNDYLIVGTALEDIGSGSYGRILVR